MNKLRKVTFEYEDGIVQVASHEEAEKWQHNFDQMIAWSNVENNNWFVRNPVLFKEFVIEQQPLNDVFDESHLFYVDQTLKTDNKLLAGELKKVIEKAEETPDEPENKVDIPAEITEDDLPYIIAEKTVEPGEIVLDDQSSLGELAEIIPLEPVELKPVEVKYSKPGRKPAKQ